MKRAIRRIRQCFAYALLLACTFVVSPRAIAATTVSDAYDQPSSLTKSSAANHTLTFVTANTVNEADTIVFTFDDAFTLSTLTEDDVDIADDSVDLTTAATCAGTEQASVEFSGLPVTILTITICAGDGGAIASGSTIQVEIGTNAASSGLGANRMTNPSNVGTYYVAISGSFGGSGSIPLPIQSDDTSSVSALVLPSAGGGSSGGGSSGGTSGGGTTGGDTGDTGGTTGDTGSTDTGSTDTGGTTTGDTGGTDSGGTSGGTTGTTSGGTTTGTSGGSTGGTHGSSGSGTGTTGTTGGGTSPTTPTEDTTTEVPTIVTDVKIYTDGGIALSPSGSTFSALAGTTAIVTVEVTTTATIEQVRAEVDGKVYVLSDVGAGLYSGSILIPSVDSTIDVSVDTIEAPTAYESLFVDAKSAGLVYENINNSRTPVGGAVVTVYRIVDGARVPWSGAANPVVIGTSGSFSFYVQNGDYIVTAGKAGYDDAESGVVHVTDNVLAPSIALVRHEEAPVIAIPTEPTPSSDNVFTATVGVIGTAVSRIIATPEVQTAADIAQPAAAVLAVTSVVVLSSSFSLLPFLQYLFTAPALFIARRKRKAFGVVYNAATKLPIDLAIVRVYAMPGHRLVRSVVTDVKGKYLVAAAPGSYVLEVTKQGFTAPSDILRGKKDDGVFLDVYTGQEVVVSEQNATIAANIPLDPAQAPETQKTLHSVALKRFLRVFQQVIAVLGVVLAALVVIISPSVLAAVMCGVQVAVYMLMRRLARPARAKGWGIVYDETTREPVGNAVVRLFEPTYNKLVETALTDRLGRYAFLVGPSEYYVTYNKPGYAEKTVKPIDLRANTEASALALDVPLQGQQGNSTGGV